MGLMEQAKKDIQQITSDLSGFGVPITFISPDPDSVTVIVNGIHSRHNTSISEDGMDVSSRKAHVSVSEQLLVDAGYPIRNAKGEIDLINHKMIVADGTGTARKYKMSHGSFRPNEMLGLITCILTELSD